MIKRARGLDNSTNCLINCSCEQRSKKIYGDRPLPANIRNNPSKLLDTTPPGHDCMSVELISLLLTGTMHSTWSGWSTEGLSFGFLSKNSGEVGLELARPEKPVWIIQGTCYSLLWLRVGKEHDPKSVAKLDKSGESLDFVHWNCWYELRNRFEFRLIAASDVWKPPPSKPVTAEAFENLRNPLESRNTGDLLLERRRCMGINQLSAKEHKSNLANAKQNKVTEVDLESVTPNPDDERYYPKDYKMWRFDVKGVCENEDNIQIDRWVPYHRLPPKHKLIVDLKLGPKIANVLWTRWPGARVDKFVPEDGSFPIV